MPRMIDKVVFVTVEVLPYRSVYVSGKIEKTVFTSVVVLCTSHQPVYVPGKIEEAVFTPMWWYCRARIGLFMCLERSTK